MKREKDPSMGNVYRFRTKEEEEEAIRIIKPIIAPYNLTVSMMHPGVMARGNQGDEPTYTRVILLEGKYPGHDLAAAISTKITNAVPVNTVVIAIETEKSP